MMQRIRSSFRRFMSGEDGAASVEFALVFPIYFGLLVMSLELSIITLRHTMLERGLDITVRDIRLGTGTAPAHDTIKTMICENALIIANCESSLRLEMVPADIRNLSTLDGDVDCTDKAQPTKPVKQFTPGQQNELMFLRACVKYDPLFPAWDLAKALNADDSGQISIISQTAFVQEPI